MYLEIFSKTALNFVAELATLVNEKLERHSVSKKATYAFKQMYKSFSQVNGANYFKTIANGRDCGTELFISYSETILIDDLWDKHVVRGVFSSVQALPDWFRSWGTLVSLYASIDKVEGLDEDFKVEIVNDAKKVFKEIFLSQKVMIKFDRNVFWRNVGTFYRVGVLPIVNLNNVLPNDIGIRTNGSPSQRRTRTIRQLPYNLSGSNRPFLDDLFPSRFQVWKVLFDNDKPMIETTLNKYLANSVSSSRFANLTDESPNYAKWIVLTSFVLAELQILVGAANTISNRTSNLNDKRKYRVAVFCVLYQLLYSVPIPDHTASQWKKFYENYKINQR